MIEWFFTTPNQTLHNWFQRSPSNTLIPSSEIPSIDYSCANLITDLQRSIWSFLEPLKVSVSIIPPYASFSIFISVISWISWMKSWKIESVNSLHCKISLPPSSFFSITKFIWDLDVFSLEIINVEINIALNLFYLRNMMVKYCRANCWHPMPSVNILSQICLFPFYRYPE